MNTQETLPEYLTSHPAWAGSVLETIYNRHPEIWEETVDRQLQAYEKYSQTPGMLTETEQRLFQALQRYAVHFLA